MRQCAWPSHQQLVCLAPERELCVAGVQAEGEDAPPEEAAGAAAAAGEPLAEGGEAAPAAEEPLMEAMEEDDSGDDDWETMDLDAIKLPSQAAPEQVLVTCHCPTAIVLEAVCRAVCIQTSGFLGRRR